MKRSFQQFNLKGLKTLYDKEVERLHNRLLNGASWEETREQRRMITELSIAMSRNSSSLWRGNPAEHRTRDSEMQNTSPS